VLRVKDGKGMRYLAELLRSPGRELFVLDLVGSEEAPASAGVALDARAKQEYGRRVEELRDALAEAERLSDSGRAERAEPSSTPLPTSWPGRGTRRPGPGAGLERRASTHQRSTAPQGRPRAYRELDPALGRYLFSTVKTGTYCSFTPL